MLLETQIAAEVDQEHGEPPWYFDGGPLMSLIDPFPRERADEQSISPGLTFWSKAYRQTCHSYSCDTVGMVGFRL